MIRHLGEGSVFASVCVVIYFPRHVRKKKKESRVGLILRHKMVVGRRLVSPLACSVTGAFRCHHECLGGDSTSREGNEANGAALVTDRLILWFA